MSIAPTGIVAAPQQCANALYIAGEIDSDAMTAAILRSETVRSR